MKKLTMVKLTEEEIQFANELVAGLNKRLPGFAAQLVKVEPQNRWTMRLDLGFDITVDGLAVSIDREFVANMRVQHEARLQIMIAQVENFVRENPYLSSIFYDVLYPKKGGE